ncbi:hypothetical protein [Nocardia cyriacigeorgica]|nr:hypothetical protein [Nocardia cyriacigeorgica]
MDFQVIAGAGHQESVREYLRSCDSVYELAYGFRARSRGTVRGWGVRA